MEANNNHRVFILGSGPAGCTAAVYLARANIDVAMITGSLRGGQLTMTPKVENWPGALEINGLKLMEDMLDQVQKLNVPIISDQIIEVDLATRPFFLKGENANYNCDALLIATGASARYLGLLSEKKFLGRGVSACATCDGFFYRKACVAVVGGGNTAVGEALYLSEIASQVTLIHRRDVLRADPILFERLDAKVKQGKIKLELNTEVFEIIGDDSGVTGMAIKNVITNEIKNIEVKGVFIAIGHKPNTEIFRDKIALRDDYIAIQGGINGDVTLTSVPGVFAAGDVADLFYRQAITAAGMGCMAARDIKKYLG